jgi:hypothetical protein
VFKYKHVAENKTKFSELQRRHTEKTKTRTIDLITDVLICGEERIVAKGVGWERIHKIYLVAGRGKRPTSIDIEEKHIRDFPADPPYVDEDDTNLPYHPSMEGGEKHVLWRRC